MPNHVKKIDGKWRVVEPNGNVTKNGSGSPVDGGGHSTFAEATRQAQAINISQHKKGEF